MNKLDQVINEIANEAVPEGRAEQAAGRVRRKLFPEAGAGSERIRGCPDYQSLIAPYLNKTLSAGRALLLQDHTRECVGCRHALEQARTGTVRTLTRPSTPPSRTIPKFWALAATVAVALAAGALILTQSSLLNGGKAAVQSVQGILYLMSGNKVTPVFPGREIPDGARVRTAKDSTAVVRLADGSLVELNERAELSVVRGARGMTIHLDRGNIIVQAAKQKNGTLDVLTADCSVSVKGTIFAVDSGTKGSRVSVVEGSVQVAHGSQKQMLKPGDQTATDASVAKTSVRDAVSWSRDSARYLSLLGEFSEIKKGLDAMPSPAIRHSSKLLAYVPGDTVLYAAIPNVGSTIGEADRLFKARLQESPVLREWWDAQKDGPKMQEMIQKLRTFSDYLGDEIVLSVSGDGSGNYSAPSILAEVKRPGLDSFLENEFRTLALHGGKGLPQLMEIPAPQSGSGERAQKRRTRYATGAAKQGPMLVGLRDNVLAVAFDEKQLESVGARMQESTVADSGLLNHVKQAYDRGASWLLCVDMEQIARHSVDRSMGDRPKLPAGLDAMRYLIVERKDVAGKTENGATLTFEGRRSGIAGWLSEPAPMGSLDFVSPNATFAVSMVLRNPQWMLNDLLRSLAENDPKFQETLDRLRNDSKFAIGQQLAAPLGGEFAFALDGPVFPLPSWKLAIEVYSPEALQSGIEALVKAVNSDPHCQGCQLTLTQQQANGRTYYTLTTAKFAYEIDYTFVDGYFLAAPSVTLLNTAIQNRATGYVLARSEVFRSQLPAGGSLNFSGVVFHNLGSVLKPLAEQGANLAGNSAQRESIQALARNTGPGLIYLNGQADRISIASNSGFFGLDLNSLALPGLLGRAMHNKSALTQ